MRFVFAILLFISFSIAAQEKAGVDKINAILTEYKNDVQLKPAIVSFCVLNAKTGDQLIENNSKLAMTPASTLKIITTASALGMLGAGYRYETKLMVDGIFDSVTGILNGNLIIKGSGDPTLNSEYFKKKDDTSELVDEWANALKLKGVKQITGRIIADNTCFDNNVPGNWIWSDMGNYFGAPPNGLSYNDNKIKLYFKTGAKTGDSTKVVKQVPEVPGLVFNNKITTGGKDDNAYVYGAPGQKERLMTGTIPANKSAYEVEIAMPDPAWYCMYALDKALLKAGVSTTGMLETAKESMKQEMQVLHSHKSPALSSIVYQTNLHSNNLFAETLLKTIALKKTGYGSIYSAIDIVLNYWKGRGVDVEGFFMSDGSGLSRSNGISTFQQATILSKIYRDNSMYKTFNASLPVAGKSGSLASLCKGTFAENNMRAKSGYITRARGYAGYVKTKKGTELSFSVLFNNYNCSPSEAKLKIEKFLEALVEL
ncbi:MAG: D-alanyl-D-alanine carboxypeptidase/D-alanyl-D-alanine-endopeptidase [Bacteroidota bacterium]|nr:D-alanyl-D-alanine carboxypeptidase/D-alanyl-D-alanine-endopeptidase [Bacteroidota bacterium]